MDPHISVERLCMDEHYVISLNDKIESEGNWDGPEYQDTADNGKKKEVKAFTFHRMDMDEVCECYITPCFVEGLDAYDGITDLEYRKNLISNEFAVKLGLQYEFKNNGEKGVNRKVLIALKGKLYFVSFVINPKEDDVELGVIIGRSFLRLTKAIVDFGSGNLTIYPNFINFNFDLDDELDALLASINVEYLPPLDITDIPPFGPSLTINHLRTQEELTREGMEEELYERIMILNERRPIIETLKYIDKHKKVPDSVLLDKHKLDREFELEEEMVGEELIRGYKAIREKSDPGVFVLKIHLEGKYNYHALVDIGSNINVIPYRIYELFRRDQVKPRSDKITMLDHSKAESMGRLLDVLCQVEVTTILANFMLLDVPVDGDVPIIVGRMRNEHAESESEDDEDYYLMRDETRKPFCGPNRAKYLNCDDPMDRALALQDAIIPFKKFCVWKKAISFLGALPIPLKYTEWAPNRSGINAKEDGDGKWNVKIRTAGTHDDEASSSRPKRTGVTEIVDEAMLGLIHHEFLLWNNYNRASKSNYNTKLAQLITKQIYSPCIVDWTLLNTLGYAEAIEEMLEIKIVEMGGQEEIFTSKAWRHAFNISEHIYTELCHEYFATYEFDEEVTDEELISKKLIKFRLGGHGNSLSLLEFARHLGLYNSAEIQEEGFEVSISSADQLSPSRSLTKTIRSPIRRYLDAITLKELIGPNGRLIVEDPSPGVPRFATPTPSRPTLHDLSESMGRMEIQQGVLERMSRRQLYHIDRYARVFKFIAGHCGVPLNEDYAPPGYDEQQHQQKE
ncbi:retrotransposon ORF1 [Tanacetum coccineum]